MRKNPTKEAAKRHYPRAKTKRDAFEKGARWVVKRLLANVITHTTGHGECDDFVSVDFIRATIGKKTWW